eukprot:TRINITY_DN5930_c0_g1_i4.p2 TRINITY_DN5930_c0_g1~~TRINITY_DN5930_c0_g1_i4.p2  ORF type:complete len:124 (+),score=35.42 TRINITY_DN5930_c0_g1_i4:91-462(+)
MLRREAQINDFVQTLYRSNEDSAHLSGSTPSPAVKCTQAAEDLFGDPYFLQPPTPPPEDDAVPTSSPISVAKTPTTTRTPLWTCTAPMVSALRRPQSTPLRMCITPSLGHGVKAPTPTGVAVN